MPTPPFERPSRAAAAAEDLMTDDAAAATTPHIELDCYPYTFSPLLLFAQEHYFDQGYSNYNSVARFFADVLEVDVLENVVFERKNMLYEELLEFVIDHRMLVTCCIDAHFTGFQVLGDGSLLYYDPLKSYLMHVYSPESYRKFAAFLLLKCNYGDNQHLVDNKCAMGPQESTRVCRWSPKNPRVLECPTPRHGRCLAR